LTPVYDSRTGLPEPSGSSSSANGTGNGSSTTTATATAELLWDRERERLKKKEREREMAAKLLSAVPAGAEGGSGAAGSSAGQEEQDMMKVMGFGTFDSTKNKKVKGNNVGEVHVVVKRKYRQYMNRKGGFNRPLDYVP